MNHFFSSHHSLFLSNEDSCYSRLLHFGRNNINRCKMFKKKKLKIMFFFLKSQKFVIFKI